MSRTGRIKCVLLVAIVALSSGAAYVHAQAGSPPNPFRPVDNYFKLPEGRTIGSTPATSPPTA